FNKYRVMYFSFTSRFDDFLWGVNNCAHFKKKQFMKLYVAK
ncbi:MAG: hypothetical protein RIQ70_519, partial [Bacteroidota bacterium]